MQAQHRPISALTASLKNEYQYIKILCKSIINNSEHSSRRASRASDEVSSTVENMIKEK